MPARALLPKCGLIAALAFCLTACGPDAVETPADTPAPAVEEAVEIPAGETPEPTARERQTAAREQLAQEQQEKHVHRRPIEEAELDARARLGKRLFYENRLSHPGANLTATCRSCHLPPDAPEGKRAFADLRPRSVIPSNSRGMKLETLRNTPTLLNSATLPYLNHDGAFTSLAELIRAKITSTHYGWLPADRERALDEIWALVLNDMGEDALAEGPYVDQFNAVFEIDVTALARAQVIDKVVDALMAFIETLETTHTAPYDAFAYLNRIGEQVDFEKGDDPTAFSGRLFGRLANQEGRVLVKFPTGFTEEAYQGLKIFYATTGSAHVGNCVACHYPPEFTDNSFHNTGVSQEAYDAVWGEGGFLALGVPGGGAARPSAGTRSFPQADRGDTADLGHWNFVDLQSSPLREDGETADAFLARMVGTFKTPPLRNLGLTDPYMHNGAYATLEEAIAQKVRACALAQAGALRNADPEFAKVRIADEDVAPLAAFLESLNELDPADFRQIVLDATIRPDPWE